MPVDGVTSVRRALHHVHIKVPAQCANALQQSIPVDWFANKHSDTQDEQVAVVRHDVACMKDLASSTPQHIRPVVHMCSIQSMLKHQKSSWPHSTYHNSVPQQMP